MTPALRGPSPSELFDTAYADYTKGRYALAIQGFQEYLETYPGTDLSDDARYWIGESHYAQKRYQDAIADFDVPNNNPPVNHLPPPVVTSQTPVAFSEANELVDNFADIDSEFDKLVELGSLRMHPEKLAAKDGDWRVFTLWSGGNEHVNNTAVVPKTSALWRRHRPPHPRSLTRPRTATPWSRATRCGASRASS